MQQEKKTLPPDLIEQYRRQMLEMYRPPAPPPEDWLDSRFPEPDFYRDREQMTPTVASVQEEPAPPAEESPFVGYLRVFVYTAEEAEPIPEARVIVSREDRLYANVATDRDGFTPVLALPSVDPALTLTPGTPTPYVTYTITVTAPGFRGERHESLPVYGNNYVTLPAPLYPLLPGEDPDTVTPSTSGPPANL